MAHTPEMTKAISGLTCTNVFFTALLYNLKIEARADLPSIAATDGVHLYYHPERFSKELSTAGERVFCVVHELLHVILFHNTRRGIRDPQRWNIACDHAVNLLCLEYGFQVPKFALQGVQYKGLTVEQIYDKLPEDAGDGGKMRGDVMDYDPAQNDGKPKSDIEREIAISTEQAAQAAKAAGQDTAGLKRVIGEAQVQREPWYQHLRRYMTSMHSRQYNWARIDARRAVLHGVVAPQQKVESMGKVVFGIDCSGSITEKQLCAMGAHITDILKDVTPSEVIAMYFDSEVCHVDEFSGPDYHVELSPHGGGGTRFEPVFEAVAENHSDVQLVVMFTDLFGSFPDDGAGCDTLWVSQTERVEVPFGELIYGYLNEG